VIAVGGHSDAARNARWSQWRDFEGTVDDMCRTAAVSARSGSATWAAVAGRGRVATGCGGCARQGRQDAVAVAGRFAVPVVVGGRFALGQQWRSVGSGARSAVAFGQQGVSCGGAIARVLEGV